MNVTKMYLVMGRGADGYGTQSKGSMLRYTKIETPR